MSALQYDLRRLVGVLSNSPDPIFIKDVDHRYHMANQAFLDTCGISSAEGKKDIELFSPEMVATVRANDQRVLQQGVVIRVEEVIELKGRWRTFFVIKFPLFDEDRRIVGMGGIATDITERRRAEEENARLTVHARAVQHAAAHKSRFLAVASHELRTPLGGIVGLAELLGRQPLDPEGRRLVGLIDDSARGLLRIVNDLLDLSKVEAGKMDFIVRPFCLREQLQTLVATLQTMAAERRVTLALDVGDDVPAWLQADVLRLRQVLTNLLGNAIKFSAGGEVHLRVQAREQGASSEAAPPVLLFEVADSGEGMAAGDLQQIFMPFYQGRRGSNSAGGSRGTGLGLPICQSIVSAMGGTIDVQSTLGQGTTFRLALPMAACEAPVAVTERQDTIAAPEVGPEPFGRVLVVEDDAVNQTVIRALLTRLGVQHSLAVDGETAVAVFEGGHYDVVLMDCMLRGMDGCEAARRILEVAGGRGRPPPRVVALTANGMREERQRCQEAGMVDLLVKPIGLRELRETLRRLSVPP